MDWSSGNAIRAMRGVASWFFRHAEAWRFADTSSRSLEHCRRAGDGRMLRPRKRALRPSAARSAAAPALAKLQFLAAAGPFTAHLDPPGEVLESHALVERDAGGGARGPANDS